MDLWLALMTQKPRATEIENISSAFPNHRHLAAHTYTHHPDFIHVIIPPKSITHYKNSKHDKLLRAQQVISGKCMPNDGCNYHSVILPQSTTDKHQSPTLSVWFLLICSCKNHIMHQECRTMLRKTVLKVFMCVSGIRNLEMFVFLLICKLAALDKSVC